MAMACLGEVTTLPPLPLCKPLSLNSPITLAILAVCFLVAIAYFFLAIFFGMPIMMAMVALPLPSLAIHLPAALHLAGEGHPSQGLKDFLVAIIYLS